MDTSRETEKKEWDQIMSESFHPLKLKDVLNPFTYTAGQKTVFFLVLAMSIFLILEASKTAFIPFEDMISPKNQSRTLSDRKAGESFDTDALVKKAASKILFKVIKKAPPPVMKRAAPKGPSLQDKIKGFILLGVMIEEPMQAMVESRGTHETFCVKAGDMITDMKVVSVENGQVTLSYNEETGVLR